LDGTGALNENDLNNLVFLIKGGFIAAWERPA
jgi:hypothetical protein